MLNYPLEYWLIYLLLVTIKFVVWLEIYISPLLLGQECVRAFGLFRRVKLLQKRVTLEPVWHTHKLYFIALRKVHVLMCQLDNGSDCRRRSQKAENGGRLQTGYTTNGCKKVKPALPQKLKRVVYLVKTGGVEWVSLALDTNEVRLQRHHWFVHGL